MAYFFLDSFACIFCFCIFFRKLANLVAGILGVLRWFIDMACLRCFILNSTYRNSTPVEFW